MTYYDILLISKSASAEEIHQAYRTLAKKYHPDLYDGDKAFAEEQMKFINEAYSVLSDPEAREEYDQKIFKDNCDSTSSQNSNTNNYKNEKYNIKHTEEQTTVFKPFILIRWPLIVIALFMSSLLGSKSLFWIGITLSLIRIFVNLIIKEYRSKGFTQIISICIAGFMLYSGYIEIYESNDISDTSENNINENLITEETQSLDPYEEYKKHYDIAQDYLTAENYEKAFDELEKYNEFWIDYYQLAEELFAEGRYEEAIVAYKEIEGYKDSRERITEAEECLKKLHYLEGEALYAMRDYDKAAEEFRLAEDYKDASDRVVEMKKAKCYDQAELYMEQKQFNEAIIEFTKAKGYKNAEDRILEAQNCIRKSYYDQGVLLLLEERFEEAIEKFEKSEHYEDADTKIMISKTGILKRYYDESCKLLSEEHYEDAITAFLKADNYQDSADKIYLHKIRSNNTTLFLQKNIMLRMIFVVQYMNIVYQGGITIRCMNILT